MLCAEHGRASSAQIPAEPRRQPGPAERPHPGRWRKGPARNAAWKPGLRPETHLRSHNRLTGQGFSAALAGWRKDTGGRRRPRHWSPPWPPSPSMDSAALTVLRRPMAGQLQEVRNLPGEARASSHWAASFRLLGHGWMGRWRTPRLPDPGLTAPSALRQEAPPPLWGLVLRPPTSETLPHAFPTRLWPIAVRSPALPAHPGHSLPPPAVPGRAVPAAWSPSASRHRQPQENMASSAQLSSSPGISGPQLAVLSAPSSLGSVLLQSVTRGSVC